MRFLGGDKRLAAVVIGGIFVALAGALCAFVTEPPLAGASVAQTWEGGCPRLEKWRRCRGSAACSSSGDR